MERKTGVEPAAFSLARRCSTTELLPLVSIDYATSHEIVQTADSLSTTIVTVIPAKAGAHDCPNR